MADDNLTKAELQANQETMKHIEKVREYIKIVCNYLHERGVNHDASKLVKPEVTYYAKYTPVLSELTYGSEEYAQCLEEMKPALDCHYAKNDHHIEFHNSGILDMDLLSILEMVVDWIASAERQDNGNVFKGLEISIERFKIDDQLANILRNTIKKLVG
jgi:hypothetical protein